MQEKNINIWRLKLDKLIFESCRTDIAILLNKQAKAHQELANAHAELQLKYESLIKDHEKNLEEEKNCLSSISAEIEQIKSEIEKRWNKHYHTSRRLGEVEKEQKIYNELEEMYKQSNLDYKLASIKCEVLDETLKKAYQTAKEYEERTRPLELAPEDESHQKHANRTLKKAYQTAKEHEERTRLLELALEGESQKKRAMGEKCREIERNLEIVHANPQQSLQEKNDLTKIIIQLKKEIDDLRSKSGEEERHKEVISNISTKRERAIKHLVQALATVLNDRAGIHHAQGDYKWAEVLLKDALQIRKKYLDPNDPNIARNLYNLAGIYRVQDQYEQAKPLLNEALQIFEQHLEAQHPEQGGHKEDALEVVHDDEAKPEQVDKLLLEVKNALESYEQMIKRKRNPS